MRSWRERERAIWAHLLPQLLFLLHLRLCYSLNDWWLIQRCVHSVIHRHRQTCAPNRIEQGAEGRRQTATSTAASSSQLSIRWHFVSKRFHRESGNGRWVGGLHIMLLVQQQNPTSRIASPPLPNRVEIVVGLWCTKRRNDDDEDDDDDGVEGGMWCPLSQQTHRAPNHHLPPKHRTPTTIHHPLPTAH